MIKKDGKSYVILEFSDEADAAYFETAFFDRHRGDLFEASSQATINDKAFEHLSIINSVNGANGETFQVGVVHGDITGRRVR